MGIQMDFGGFDPSFIGITRYFGNPRVWQFNQEFTRSQNPVSVLSIPHEQAFEALATVSVLSHEIRHFHDFLLSPYQANLFRLRIQSLVNLLGIAPYILKGEDINCLPVPISKWC